MKMHWNAAIGTCLVILLTGSANAQDKLPLQYYLKSETSIQECNSKGDPAGLERKLLPAWSGFTIVEELDNEQGYVIKFWSWKADQDSTKKALAADVATGDPNRLNNAQKAARFNEKQDGDHVRYFLLSKSDLEKFAIVKSAQLSPIGGVVALPFKLRPQYGDISTDLSIAGMYGSNLLANKLGDFKAGVLIGLGVTSITVDSTSTDGKTTQSSDRFGYTLSTGLLVQWHTLQLGAVIGWDHLSRADRKQTGWLYHGAPWLGFGIGAAIFKEDKAASDAGKNN